VGALHQLPGQLPPVIGLLLVPLPPPLLRLLPLRHLDQEVELRVVGEARSAELLL